MKFLHEFSSFEKLVLSRAEMGVLTVDDAVDYGREFFGAGYDDITDCLEDMEKQGKIDIEAGKVRT